LGERNIKKNDEEGPITLVKNRYYTIINLFLAKFYLNARNLYQVNTFIKLLSLRGRYLFLVHFQEAYDREYKLKNVINFGIKPLKWYSRVNYFNS